MSKDIWAICNVHSLYKRTNNSSETDRVILEETVRDVAIMFLEVRTFLRNQRKRLAAQACKRGERSNTQK